MNYSAGFTETLRYFHGRSEPPWIIRGKSDSPKVTDIVTWGATLEEARESAGDVEHPSTDRVEMAASPMAIAFLQEYNTDLPPGVELLLDGSAVCVSDET